MLELTANNVQSILFDCLFKEEELEGMTKEEQRMFAETNGIIVKGIINTLGFHNERVALNKEEIIELIKQTPTEFHKSGGGGMSFLNLCMTNNGVHWGEHCNIEQLVFLATAAGLGGYLGSPMLWQAMPGGMPYVVFYC